MTSDFDLKSWVERRRAEVDEALDRALPPEEAATALIDRAMRYAVFAGGKRLRPILALAGCEAVGGSTDHAINFACASELIHTYSLVHDDLPVIDNDDLRRGRPTVHKAFDEATAVLTGDALLTQAFEVALGKPARPAPSRAGGEAGIDGRTRIEALRILAGAIGTAGMIGGQVDDLLATGGPVDAAPGPLDPLERKTGALLRACPLIGWLLLAPRPGRSTRSPPTARTWASRSRSSTTSSTSRGRPNPWGSRSARTSPRERRRSRRRSGSSGRGRSRRGFPAPRPGNPSPSSAPPPRPSPRWPPTSSAGRR